MKYQNKNIFLKAIFFTIIFFYSISIFAQNEDNYAGARSSGMGKAGVTLSDIWAVFNNPAGTSDINGYAVGAFYENRFLMKETGYAALAFSCPLFSGNINFGATYFGYSLFSQNKIALGYSQQLFRNFSMGLQINYFSTRQGEYYGNFNGLTFDLGFLYKPIEGLSLGGYVFNPINVGYFENSKIKMPLALKFGISYLFSKKLLLAVETGKAINGYIPIFKTGIEYTLRNIFVFRGGFSVKPVEFSAGFGYKNEHLHVDIAYSYHQILGSTPKLSVSYEF
ncbi:MAG: hypothetical protein LBV69_06330 [Bacteroidales bacterium]|jgi:hypothetical protein|nr:hypothetical protein [Bacteroidales bacterium]